jgi:hypothetical protein
LETTSITLHQLTQLSQEIAAICIQEIQNLIAKITTKMTIDRVSSQDNNLEVKMYMAMVHLLVEMELQMVTHTICRDRATNKKAKCNNNNNSLLTKCLYLDKE